MISRDDRVLIIAAHPDDETIGMGGSIAKFVELQLPLFVLFITDGVTSRGVYRESLEDRRQASLIALSKLGVNESLFLDFQDNKLDDFPRLHVIKEIEKVIESFQPTLVFTNSIDDLNVDHRIVSECSIVATRPYLNSPIRALFNFEVCSSTDLFFGKPTFNPNFFINISSHFIRKLDALSAYSVELDSHPSGRSVETITARNTYWGGYSGYSIAEAFKLLYFLHG